MAASDRIREVSRQVDNAFDDIEADLIAHGELPRNFSRDEMLMIESCRRLIRMIELKLPQEIREYELKNLSYQIATYRVDN